MKDDATSNVRVLVTIAESHREAISSVAKQLRAAGLVDANSLSAAGIVTGTVAHGQLSALKSISGVAAVEIEGQVEIPPPDSDVQ